MIEIGKLTDEDIGRALEWTNEEGAHRGTLAYWETRRLAVDEQWEGHKGQRVFVDPSTARFVA